jgi:hypothetical protein
MMFIITPKMTANTGMPIAKYSCSLVISFAPH